MSVLKFVILQVAIIILGVSSGVFAADLGFHDESELGAAVVSGNSNSETYNFKQTNTYVWEYNLVKLTGRYLNTRSTAGSGPSQTGLADTARSWDASLRYERVLSESFSAFTQYGLESDIFNGYVQRNNFDLGGKYFISKSEETNWSAEAGYRNIMTHYPASAPDLTTNNLRLYTEVSQAINGKTALLKLYIEYIQAISSTATSPGYSAAQDYQLNAEPSLYASISQVFSVKVGYLFKYMNYIPPNSVATKFLDTIFTTSLVAKF